MENKVNDNSKYRCNICNKNYASMSSLCNHNKKFHINNIIPIPQIPQNSTQIPQNSTKNNCKYCNKILSRNDSRLRHEKKCKETNNIDKETELIRLQLQLKKEESKILQLKLKLEKSDKLDNMTVRKLNKLLTVYNNNIKNINLYNTQNNITNNFNLIGFGKEDVVEKLSNQEKKLIMNAKYSSLDKLINIVHCGKYNQFKNIIITNMKDNYMYKYDDKVGHFVLSTKADVLNSLIDYRLDDLEIIYNDLLEKNKLDENTKDIIEKFINKINYDQSRYTDYDGKEHDNYKQYKINEIKILLFNNQDKITNDISLLLTTSE